MAEPAGSDLVVIQKIPPPTTASRAAAPATSQRVDADRWLVGSASGREGRRDVAAADSGVPATPPASEWGRHSGRNPVAGCDEAAASGRGGDGQPAVPAERPAEGTGVSAARS